MNELEMSVSSRRRLDVALLMILLVAIGSPKVEACGGLEASGSNIPSPLFELKGENLALYERAVAVRRRLLPMRTVDLRLTVQLPEMTSEMAKAAQAFDTHMAEIQIWQEALSKLVSEGKFESYRSTRNPTLRSWYYEQPENLKVDLIPVLRAVRLRLFEYSESGPMYKQVIAANTLIPKLGTFIIGLRREVYGSDDHYNRPLTLEAAYKFLKAKPLRAANRQFAALMFFHSGRSTGPVLAGQIISDPTSNITEIGREFLSDSDLRTIGLPIFGDRPFPISLDASLSVYNIKIIQAPLTLTIYHNLDGASDESLPDEFQIHDLINHFRFSEAEPSGQAVRIVKKYCDRIQATHPQWMRLLALLVFYHKHEMGLKIADLKTVLPFYGDLENQRSDDPGLLPLLERYEDFLMRLDLRMANDLYSRTLTPLFQKDWKPFIKLLQTVD